MSEPLASDARVAQIWASGRSAGEISDDGLLFFEGETIFSFGRHFPIARHQGGAVLVTTESYPVPTTAHIALVRDAVADCRIFTVPDVEARTVEEHKANFRDYGRRISRRQTLSRQTSGVPNDVESRALVEEANAYAGHFGLSVEPYAWDPAPA
ncbi:MAG: hypothetical protein AAF495_21525 [Pseudomonadota bacterium]